MNKKYKLVYKEQIIWYYWWHIFQWKKVMFFIKNDDVLIDDFKITCDKKVKKWNLTFKINYWSSILETYIYEYSL